MDFDNGFPVSFSVQVVLTPEDIDDIMVTALEGGINHWCDKAEVVGKYLGEYASDQISRGGTLWLHSLEDNNVHVLTLNKFLDGVQQWLEKEKPFEIFNDYRLDISAIDAPEADIIIQYALFYEIIYG